MAAPPTPRTAAALKEAESLEARAALAERTASAHARIRKAAALELASEPPRGQDEQEGDRGGGGGGGEGGGALATSGAAKRRKSPVVKLAEVTTFPPPMSTKGKFAIGGEGDELQRYATVHIDDQDQVTFNDSTDAIGDVEAVAKATAAVIKRECTAVQGMSFLRIVMRDLKEASIAGESESGDPLHFSDTDIAKIASTEDLTMINKRVSEIMTKGGIDLRLFTGQFYMPLLELACRFLLLRDCEEIEEITAITLG
jgi:hypothetical protein